MKKYVITIARGFGSGGKEIGVKLGERLGIPCYEQQLLRMASEQSGINEALFNLADEKLEVKDRLKGLPFNYVVEPSDKRFTSNNNLFNIQSELIRKLSKVYEEQTGSAAALKTLGGGTYAKSMPNLVAFGPIFPGDVVREHQANEYVPVEWVLRNAEIIGAAMYELAQ